MGALVGLTRAMGVRPGPVLGAVVTTAVALVASNAPMTLLKVSDPRTWSVSDWVSDVLPHLAYGVVTSTSAAVGDQPTG